MADKIYDLLIIGGGINGVGIANEASQRGLSVLLAEQNDLASATSSASSKLIHGGLRYLEYYEFRLVREALTEREVLLQMAPHIIWPLRFVLPHHKKLRPTWMIRAGLFMYDHLGGRKILPASTGLKLRNVSQGQPLKPRYRKGFEYSDCWVDDARLVVLNALQAKAHGADILTRSRVESAHRVNGVWQATLKQEDGRTRTVQARGVVNAAGPWVDQVLKQRLNIDTKEGVQLIKGSHIVVPKLHDGSQAYILQNHDNRIAFVIPYEQDFSLIGTTDVPYSQEPGKVSISQDEVEYLCQIVSEYFNKPVKPSDVVWSYAGVRPLFDDDSDNPSAVTRDYVLTVHHEKHQAPLLSVFGGKITTYRQLALSALKDLAPFYPQLAPAAKKPMPLPGGDLPDADFEQFVAGVYQQWHWLPRAQAYRLARNYGSRISQLLEGCQQLSDLGQDFGAGLSQREVEFLVAEEWAKAAEDILWRRTKRGLHMSEAQRSAFADWFQQHYAAPKLRLVS